MAVAATEPPRGPFLLAGGATGKVTAVTLTLGGFPSCKCFLLFFAELTELVCPFLARRLSDEFQCIFRFYAPAEE